MLPPRILFVGGFISFEFAHICSRAGSAPVIIDRGLRPLKAFDPVVHGAGRTPELSSLDLDAAGVDWDEHGVHVAGHLQSTTNPAVYAAGDSANTPGMPLTPVAVIEGKAAASNMLKGTTTVPGYAGVPTAVFTIPELARVGMLEQEAKDQGIDVDVRYSDTSGWYSNYRVGETSAAAKILVDRPSDRIVGAHLLGPELGPWSEYGSRRTDVPTSPQPATSAA